MALGRFIEEKGGLKPPFFCVNVLVVLNSNVAKGHKRRNGVVKKQWDGVLRMSVSS